MTLGAKQLQLEELLKQAGKVAIAFSGGVDSTFLAATAFKALGENSLALTIDTLFIPRSELEDSRVLARRIGINHQTIAPGIPDDSILANPPERCYLCKKSLFKTLKNHAAEKGFPVLMDGSNTDDLSDYRPGMMAVKELGVRSPLIECGFSKDDIRRASRKLELPTWDKPSLACLASRIPYHTPITKNLLGMVEAAEAFIGDQGLKQFRVRVHGNLARIEVAPEERRLFFDLEKLDRIAAELKKIGFTFVSLDLEGYKTGKLNQHR